MGLQFARTFTQQALLDAWQEVRDSALADGRLDPELEQFEADAARRVSHLAVALAEGEWRPLPAHQLEISKPSGGTRRLTIPPLADRVVERALLVTLDREIDPSLLPWSFAYRRGLGTRDALAALAEARDTGATWVARADIRDCFDRIPRWEVMRLVRERIDDERIVHLVGLILNRPVVNHRSAPADRGRGLHQGSVLAPLLSNLYLDTFDRRMLAAGHRVIRYTDDFAIPTESRLEGEQALKTAATELEDLRLELNSGKCHVVSFDEGVHFLGEMVTASTLNSAETLSHPLETVVYVERQGAYVRTRGDRLVVTDGEESLLRLSLRRVRQVVCYGRVGLSTPFLQQAGQRGIEVVLLNEHGTDGGRLTPLSTTDPSARRAQYRAADDPGQCRALAAAFVTGKVSNMRVTLLRTARRRDDLAAAETADRLEKTLDALDQNPPLDEILGLEGSAARDYFQAARKLIGPEWGLRGTATPPAARPGERDALLRLHPARSRGGSGAGDRWARPHGGLPAPASLGPSRAGAGPDGRVPPHHRRRRRLALH